CVIPDGLTIGQDLGVDSQHFFVTKRGVVLVTPDMLRARAAATKSAQAAAAAPPTSVAPPAAAAPPA
ncbi:MAG: hypothetical protein ACLPWG_01615, partial [Steroidobacteraceae bacterium]